MAAKRRKGPKRPKRPPQGGAPAAVSSKHALPTCEGPKLGRFKHGSAAIQFVNLLSAGKSEGDGHVFEVIIKSKHYALKMARDRPLKAYSKSHKLICDCFNWQFHFFDPPDEASSLANRGVSDETFIAHFDPFYAECRAYGRIERSKRNGDIAVRCHGFMAVSAEREEDLAAPPFEISSDEWNRPEQENDWPITARQPFRAIVKELVRSKKRLCWVAQMRKDLLDLQHMGVYVQDVREDNYINGKLVDFSRSWTDPHIMLDPDIRSQDLINLEIEGDLLAFDRMLEEAGVRTRLKALSGSNATGRLRSEIKKPDRFGF